MEYIVLIFLIYYCHVTHKLLPVYIANAAPGRYKRVIAGMGSTKKKESRLATL